ncbi:WGR domain-containing protein, partial [Staphylococcus aureus]|nr:WGR domain-containing protein [Staphylococcus aureus]
MPKSQTVVDIYRLTFQSGSSNKFYNVYIAEDGTVVLRWGRMHTHGQSSVSAMPTYDDAVDLGMRQVYAKKSKGYTQQYA